MENSEFQSQPSRSALVEKAGSYRRNLVGPFLYLMLIVQSLSMAAWYPVGMAMRADLTFPEGAVAARSLAVARGECAYADWREWPHQFAPYGPLTYYPVGWVARATHAETDPFSIYRLGRIQSLLFIAGLLGAVVALGRSAGWGWGWAFVTVVTVCNWPYQIDYISTFRPDAPKACLAFWAFWGMCARPPRRGAILAVSALLMASFWYKPTSWGLTLIGLGWVARERGWRAGAGWLAAFGAAGLALALALDRMMDGRLLLNMVRSLQNGISLDVLAIFATRIMTFPMLLLLATAFFSIWKLTRRPAVGDSRERLVMTAYLATLALALAQCLKVGADLNYLTEPYLLGCLIAVGEVRGLWTRAARGGRAGMRAEVLLWVLLGGMLAWQGPQLARDAGSSFRIVARAIREGRVQSFFALPVEPQARILSNKPYIPLIFGSPDSVMDRLQFRLLAESGDLDASGLRERVEGRRFDYIAIEPYYFGEEYASGFLDGSIPELFYPGFFKSLRSNYALSRDESGPNNHGWTIWRPRRQGS